MRASSRLCVVAVIAAGFMLAAPVSTATAPTSPTYPVGAGDVLQITFYAGGAEQENFSAEVSGSGKITTPLLGELSVKGLIPDQIAQRLTELLSKGYYVNPQVMVNVKSYAGMVYVIGEVKRPGAYNVRDGLTALNACILAGGFSDYAAPNRVKVIRNSKGDTQVFKIDLRKVQKGKKPDLLLEPGDRIDVPRRHF